MAETRIPLALILLAFTSASAHANWMPNSHWVEAKTITDNSGGHTGRSVSVSGTAVLVGAPYHGADPFNPLGTGSAWLGTLSDTGLPILGTEITGPDSEEGDLFGLQVLLTTLDGSDESFKTGFITAPRRTGEAGELLAGAVYRYQSDAHGGLVHQSTLVPSSQSSNQMFGTSITCDGQTLAVGAPRDMTNALTGGCVYVYAIEEGGTIVGEQRLDPRYSYQEQFFGFSVAVDGDRIAVGAFADSHIQPYAGAVYIYERDADSMWQQVDVIAPDELAGFDFFGTAVALHDDTLIATSNNRSVGNYANVGRAYVFQKIGDDWMQTQTIDPPLISNNVYWGASICWEDDLLVIGANGMVDDGVRTGAASVLRQETNEVFAFQQTLVADGLGVGAAFGIATDIEDGRIIVGAPELTLESGGAAFSFDETCIGDLDGDHRATIQDVMVVVSQWDDNGISTADLNQDFTVDVSDLMIAAASWGVCP